MRKILVGLFDQRMDPTVIYCDNQSCIKLFENPLLHDRSKHINVRYHHLRDCVARRIMFLQYISIEEQDADISTTTLSKCKFEFHRDRIRVADNPFLFERVVEIWQQEYSNLICPELNCESKSNLVLTAT